MRRKSSAALAAAVLVAIAAAAAPALAQTGDAIDLHAAVQTPRGAADRPITATITRLDLSPTGMRVEFSKKDGPDRWAPVPVGVPGSGDNIQYTVWIGSQLSDGWHVAASLNVWFGLENFGGPMATPQQYSSNVWYLDAALAQHTPRVGEALAFFVTSGMDRGASAHLVLEPTEHLLLERSSVVVVPMPGPGGASYTFAAAPPVVTPPPVVVPPSPQPLPSVDLTGVYAQLSDIRAMVAELARASGEAHAAIHANVTDGRAENRTFFDAVRTQWKAIVGKAAIYAGPIIAALFAGRATK